MSNFHLQSIKVQFNLFGGTVIKLGSKRHHDKYIKGICCCKLTCSVFDYRLTISGIDNLNDIGCFGLTELGYGNNAVEMETTAIYDQVSFCSLTPPKGFNEGFNTGHRRVHHQHPLHTRTEILDYKRCYSCQTYHCVCTG